MDRFSRNSCARHCVYASRISSYVEEGQKLVIVGMTKGQKFRRVLISRWGVLTFASVILATYVLSLFPDSRPNDQFLNLMKIGVFFSPVAVFFWGFVSFEEQDYEKRLEENPDEERGEDLISFLYEDEEEK